MTCRFKTLTLVSLMFVGLGCLGAPTKGDLDTYLKKNENGGGGTVPQTKAAPFSKLISDVELSDAPQKAPDFGDIDELVADGKKLWGPYRLYPGDLVEVKVFDHSELDRTFRVPSDGAVSLPHAGEIEPLGMTLDGFSETLKTRIQKNYLRDPQLTLTVREYAVREANILGSVKRPGAFQLPAQTPMTLLQLISLAGGFMEDGDQERVVLVRRRPSGDRRQYLINVREISLRGQLNYDITLYPGDTVIVERLRQIYVLGAVLRPGGFPFSSAELLTVPKAIGLAGGFLPEAARRRLTLIRNDGRRQQVFRISFEGLTRNREMSVNLPLKPNDTIVVPQQDRVYVLGSVNRPTAFFLGEEPMTVTKAIAIAGGFTRIASPNRTILARETEDGKRIREVIPVKTIINEGLRSKDYRLQSGDIIFVPESFF